MKRIVFAQKKQEVKMNQREKLEQVTALQSVATQFVSIWLQIEPAGRKIVLNKLQKWLAEEQNRLAVLHSAHEDPLEIDPAMLMFGPSLDEKLPPSVADFIAEFLAYGMLSELAEKLAEADLIPRLTENELLG